MIDRRRLLGSGVLALAAAGLGGGISAGISAGIGAGSGIAPRALRLLLEHRTSGEHVALAWPVETELEPTTSARVAWVLRDRDTGEQHPIDRTLLAALVATAAALGVPAVYEVLDGFRSPHRLGAVGLHGLGRALDVRLAGVPAARLAAAAAALGSGGVGHYRAADFVHLDTGARRSWSG